MRQALCDFLQGAFPSCNFRETTIGMALVADTGAS